MGGGSFTLCREGGKNLREKGGGGRERKRESRKH